MQLNQIVTQSVSAKNTLASEEGGAPPKMGRIFSADTDY